jgi:hypothetical protein
MNVHTNKTHIRTSKTCLYFQFSTLSIKINDFPVTMNWLAANSTVYAYDNFVNCSGTLTPAFSRLRTVIPLPHAEPVFLNVYGAQESIPRNEFRQPM